MRSAETEVLELCTFFKHVGQETQRGIREYIEVKSWLQKKHALASNLQARKRENKQQKHDYGPIWSLL